MGDRVSQLIVDALELPPSEFQVTLDGLETDRPTPQARSALVRVNQLVAASVSNRILTRALSESAVSITSLRGRSDTLRQIVVTTRSITGADMAYISLNEPTGNETRIIETEGVWTEEYRSICMPFHTGVLGRVAKANGPIQVSDYLNETDMDHIAHIDAAVAKEGVRAILGSPLRVGGDIIGALMVAERRPHRFSASQVFAVEALANQAAVALDNLRLLEEVTSSLAHVESAQAQSRSYIQRLETLTRADDRLFASMMSKEGLPGLAHCLEELLSHRVDVFTATAKLLLPHRPAEDSTVLRGLLSESSGTNAPAQGRLDSVEDVTVMASMVENQLLGGIVVHGFLTEDQQSVLKRAALVLSTFISYANVSRRDRERQRSELLTSLLHPSHEGITAATIKQAEQYGVSEGFPFRLAVVHGIPESLREAESQLEARLGDQYLRATIHEHLCIVAPESMNPWITDHFTRLTDRMGKRLLMAQSEPIRQLKALPAEFSLTDRILHAAHSLGVNDNIVSWKSLGAIGMFLANTDEETIKTALRRSIHPLIQYDSTHHTTLRDSALAFLDAGQNIAKAAKALVVHPDTVRQRLDRVDALLGEGWREGSRALDIHVMLTVSKTMAIDSQTPAPLQQA
ncbi:MAG: GAF domain-containing protein [Arthrobacter sp.]